MDKKTIEYFAKLKTDEIVKELEVLQEDYLSKKIGEVCTILKDVEEKINQACESKLKGVTKDKWLSLVENNNISSFLRYDYRDNLYRSVENIIGEKALNKMLNDHTEELEAELKVKP